MNNKGFTLVELLAIVVIISVIATVAVPNIMQSNLLMVNKLNLH